MTTVPLLFTVYCLLCTVREQLPRATQVPEQRDSSHEDGNQRQGDSQVGERSHLEDSLEVNLHGVKVDEAQSDSAEAKADRVGGVAPEASHEGELADDAGDDGEFLHL